MPRLCDGRIIERPDIQNNGVGPHCRLLGDRRAAFRAEMPEDRIAAAADATERFECALDGHRLLGHSNQRSKGAAGEFLAIPAMTHRCARRVGLGCVAHRAAEATAFDLHLDPFLFYPFGSRPNECWPYIVPALWPRPTEFYTLVSFRAAFPASGLLSA